MLNLPNTHQNTTQNIPDTYYIFFFNSVSLIERGRRWEEGKKRGERRWGRWLQEEVSTIGGLYMTRIGSLAEVDVRSDVK